MKHTCLFILVVCVLLATATLNAQEFNNDEFQSVAQAYTNQAPDFRGPEGGVLLYVRCKNQCSWHAFEVTIRFRLVDGNGKVYVRRQIVPRTFTQPYIDPFSVGLFQIGRYVEVLSVFVKGEAWQSVEEMGGQ